MSRSGIVSWSCLCSLMIVAAWAYSSFASGGCERYERYLKDEKSHARLLDWADKAIFSREFHRSQVWVGNAVGPGRLGAYRPDNANLALPEAFDGAEVRPLGKNLEHPVGIFVGHSSYCGLMIARGDLDQMLADAGLALRESDQRLDRVALICAPPR